MMTIWIIIQVTKGKTSVSDSIVVNVPMDRDVSLSTVAKFPNAESSDMELIYAI